MSDYPILVERYTPEQATTIVCEDCGAEEVMNADDLLNDGLYACPARCPGSAVHKYQEADHKCGGCGSLGFFAEALNYCCSRSCMFQAEYARNLEANRVG